jgi:hypothetical protein
MTMTISSDVINKVRPSLCNVIRGMLNKLVNLQN